MKYFKSFTLLSLLAIAIVGCEYEHPVPEPISDDPVTFTDDIIPYFNASCNMSGCHNTGGIAPDLTPANAYNALISGNFINTAEPEKSQLYKKIKPGASMAQYSTPAETAKVLKWITEGAQNN